MGKRTNTAVWLDDYNRWQIKVQKDGERRTFTSSKAGRAGQRECNKKADEWLDDGIVSTNKSVATMLDTWLEEVKKTTSHSNYLQYNQYVERWIKPKIGKVKMGDLSLGHLQSVIINAFDKGRLAKKTLMNIRGSMSSFLKYARKYKATALIPVDIDIPKKAKAGVRKILQPDDLIILFSNNQTLHYGNPVDEWYINAFRFEVVTGLRPGELKGLRWPDIKGHKVYIQRSVNVFGEETTGKNDNARRSFVLTATALDILSKQLEMLNNAGILSDLVFPSENGEQIIHSSYFGRWAKYRDNAGISARVSLYEMRHTFVSMVKLMPDGFLKQLVGHSKDMDTYGVYGHEATNDAEQTAEMVQKAITNILKPKSKSKE